jgi:hypothetical protein
LSPPKAGRRSNIILFTSISVLGGNQRIGSWFMAFGAKCAVSGYPLCGSVPDPVLDVCHPDSLFQFADPGKVALVVQPEPNDGCGGRISPGEYRLTVPSPNFSCARINGQRIIVLTDHQLLTIIQTRFT